MTAIVDVAVAAIVNPQNEVLISLRRKDVHQGGLWEFPGGKVEADESIEQALSREIYEELKISILTARPCITIKHAYDDKTVCLHVWKVGQYSVESSVNVHKNLGAEGQIVKWLAIDKLNYHDFPAADKAIIRALQLPQRYLISGEFTSLEDFNRRLNVAIEQGIRLIQLRIKSVWYRKNIALAQQLVKSAIQLCEKNSISLMLNSPDELNKSVLFEDVSGQANSYIGLHFDSSQLHRLSAQNIQIYQHVNLLAASCHTLADIQKAQSLGLDFIVLSPVKATRSHPDATPLGWQAFASMVSSCTMPVYALGGMAEDDLMPAWQAGAQGIAGISFCW